jgi:hypothetical protein
VQVLVPASALLVQATAGGPASEGATSTHTGVPSRPTVVPSPCSPSPGAASGSSPPPPVPASPGTTAHVTSLPSGCAHCSAEVQGAPSGAVPAKMAWQVMRASGRPPPPGRQLAPCAARTWLMQLVATVAL